MRPQKASPAPLPGPAGAPRGRMRPRKVGLAAAGAEMALTVDRLIFRGDALGKGEDGRAVFVPFAAPGEAVRVRIVEERPDYRRAALLEVVAPSPDRRVAPCPHFTVCGGCHWLHLAERAQQHWKERILREHLARGARIPEPPVRLLRSPVPALGYCWRARFRVARVADGFHLGYYRMASRQVEDLEACPLLAPPLNHLLAALRALGPAGPRAFPGLREVHFQGSEATGRLLCRFLLAPGGRVPPLRPLFDALAAAAPALAGVSVEEETEDGWRRRGRLGEEAVEEQVGGARLRVSAGSSFPASGTAAGALAAEVLGLAEPRGSERVLDLYCGVGIFAVLLGLKVASVVGVEGDGRASADARHNAWVNGCRQVRIWEGTPEAFLRTPDAGQPWDLVLLEPPGAGLSRQVLEGVVALAAPRLLYVARDVSTFARDAGRFRERGYALEAVQPLDCSPQTYHSEVVARLARQPGGADHTSRGRG